MHYKLPIVGFRIKNFAYITDAKTIPDSTFDRLHGIDTLVINALRKKEHLSHMTVEEAIEAINRIEPRITYLTHFADAIGKQAEVEPTLPSSIRMAYDNLSIEIPE